MAAEHRAALLDLEDPACTDAGRAGSKGARLAELLQAGFPVPRGLVITVDALAAFCRHNALQAALARNDREALDRGLREGCWPPRLLADLEARVAALEADVLAVRSSSPAEDGAAQSMAGQFLTCLGVGPGGVAEAARRCWASALDAAPGAYRQRMGGEAGLAMAVVVQVQVAARRAGVLFSLDPVRRAADHWLVEWTDGLADRLVAGAITPYRRRLRRDAAPADGGDPLERQLAEVCRWGARAEARYRLPVDLEWAADAEAVWVVQVRPQTAWLGPETRAWTNVNMAENFPRPLAPLAWSLVDCFYAAYMEAALGRMGWTAGDLARVRAQVRRLNGVHGGRIYYDLHSWYALLGCFPWAGALRAALDHYIGQGLPYRLGADPSAPRLGRLRRARIAAGFPFRLLGLLAGAGRRLARAEAAFQAQRRHWQPAPATPFQALAALEQRFAYVRRAWGDVAAADILVMVLPAATAALGRRWLGRDAATVATELFRGLDLASIRPSRAIWAMARHIAGRPEQAALLRDGLHGALEDSLEPPQRRRLAGFMEAYGGRCYHDCTLVAPTFLEQPALYWDLVRRYLDGDLAEPAAGRQAAAAQARDTLECWLAELAPARRWVFRRLAAAAQDALALRERGRLLQSLLFGELRRAALALGEQLWAAGHLQRPEQVFELRLEEVRDLLEGRLPYPETLAEVVALREQARRQAEAGVPPEFFLLEPGEQVPDGESPLAPTPDGRLQGIGVARGTAQGRARIVLEPGPDTHLDPGDILVARATDPGWTPLFSLAGALVLERGGMLSHGAIVAREFGIPAVTGVDGATRAIAEGQWLRVDGNRGRVELLAEPEADPPAAAGGEFR